MSKQKSTVETKAPDVYEHGLTTQSETTTSLLPGNGPLGQSVQVTPVPNRMMRGSQLRAPLSIDTPITECPTNLDLTTPRGRALLFSAGNPADYDMGKETSIVVIATHWLVYPDEIEDEETGEIRQFARVVLFDKAGKFFKTSSQWGVRRMRAAVELFKPHEWERGIPFLVTRRLGKRDRWYHDIRVVMDEEIVPAGA